MARSKARVYTCCALMLLCVIAAIVIICVLVRRKCPDNTFSSAAVAADTKTCSEIGRDMLRRGGSAVDGAIAALLCTSVMNPQSMGIGGGSIFTVMDSSGEVKIINSRETVPKNVRPNLLQSCPKSFQLMSGPQWIGVPGEVRGYEKAHRLYGKLPWSDLFEPTIRLARDGFPIPTLLGRYIEYLDTNQTQSLKKLYSDEDGKLLKTGDVVKLEKLAETLESIATDGADAFYTGKIAEHLISDIQQAGYDLKPQNTLTYHRYIEAFKFANGLKKHIRDPKFSSEDVKKFTEESFADSIRSLITDDRTHDPQFYNVTSYMDGLGTTHVSVLDQYGSAVSVTSTINHLFGSKVFSPNTGVILNNELSDFCGRADNIFPGQLITGHLITGHLITGQLITGHLITGHLITGHLITGQLITGEQPPSSMAPTVLKSPSKTLVIGGSGGSRITTGIASALMNHLWFGKSLEEAIAAPVVFVTSDNSAQFESKFDQDVIRALKGLGHKDQPQSRFSSVVNAVEEVDGCICAVSDARKLGEAAGY
ncbi:Glutathione hydrolase 5 proenzyme [Nibea albiflora]|uniref:Glutathione hydrolase 5 proenzyme n=1 Tax=Nibea albiflora TaxID=240163 RepID=A0ACB7FD88_NIBAL|nr:Glutathione hydrolase 5 proenzyme [Nibea albiflora]